MGGFSVECDCGKWFLTRDAYRDHCKYTGHVFDELRSGPKRVKPVRPRSEERQEWIEKYGGKNDI